jgi:hypothetical protein
MGTAPSFHNPGLIRMWYESPLRDFNPHVLMGILAVLIIAWIYYYFAFVVKKARVQEQMLLDSEEGKFQQLLTKRTALLNKMVELEDIFEAGEINEFEFSKKINAYKQHLVQVKLDLKKFTD